MRILTNEQPNPIGDVYVVTEVEEQIDSLTEQWDALIGDKINSISWLKPWTWWRKSNLIQVTNFLMLALDELIKIVDNLVEKGADKKATVLDAISRLYDYTAAEALPIWLKPFAGRVKNYIIYTLMSTAIDWIVNQYRNGSWRDKIQPE